MINTTNLSAKARQLQCVVTFDRDEFID